MWKFLTGIFEKYFRYVKVKTLPYVSEELHDEVEDFFCIKQTKNIKKKGMALNGMKELVRMISHLTGDIWLLYLENDNFVCSTP